MSASRVFGLFVATLAVISGSLSGPVRSSGSEGPDGIEFSDFEVQAGGELPLVKVAVGDGVVGTFAVDTGCGESLVSSRLVREAHIPTSRRQDPSVSATRRQHSAGSRVAIARSFYFGSVRLQDVPLMETTDLPRHDATRIDGVIGSDTLRDGALLLDYGRKRLKFWSRGKLSNKALRSLGFGSPIPQPLHFRARHSRLPSVVARLNEEVEDDFIIDSGSRWTRIPARTARDLRLIPEVRGIAVHTAYGPGTDNQARLRTLVIGPLSLKGWLINYPVQEVGPLRDVALLGADVLCRYRVLLDYPAERVLFE